MVAGQALPPAERCPGGADRLAGAEQSRAGLYVQKSGADTPTVPLLLYRGSAEVGKRYGVMPHRKWRMEFQTNQFPDYTRWMTHRCTSALH